MSKAWFITGASSGIGLGFSDHEVARPGSNRLVDAVVAYGTPEAIAKRLNEHLEAELHQLYAAISIAPPKGQRFTSVH